MTSRSTPVARRSVRAAVARGAALVVVAAALGACAATEAPLPPVTVTVTPTEAAPATADSTAIPTVAGTSSTPTTPTTTPRLSGGSARGATTSFADAQARLARAKADPKVTGPFTSPTGNIFCTVAAGTAVAGCEVQEGRIAPLASMSCPGGGGGATDIGRVELRPEGAVPVCNSDTIRVPDAPPLPYGSKTAAPGGPFQCVSESAGVTCVDTATKRGFFITKGAFTTF